MAVVITSRESFPEDYPTHTKSLSECSELQKIYLFNNKLSGIIPDGLGTLSNLSVLFLANNNLTGGVPLSLGSNSFIRTVILINNTLTGGIPPLLANSSSLQLLDLTNNHLSGEIPSALFNSSSIVILALGVNNFVGSIPPLVHTSSPLEILILSENNLSGSIPTSLGNFSSLTWLLLSQNSIKGAIPSSLSIIPTIEQLDLSFNNLSGDCNKLLCASIPLLQLPQCNTEASKKWQASVILKIVGFTALCLVLLSWFAVVLLKKRKKVTQSSHPSSKELMQCSYPDLVKATNDFSLANLVGSGKSGSVYKGRFEFEEHTVAIKVFKLDQLGIPKSFIAECKTLRNTRHRNLLRVITACSTFDTIGNEFKALILEYMPNGSLEGWLYPNLDKYGLKRPLSLGSRITIVTDIASALDYLHNHCVPPVVHCDLKPSNILLDDVMGARLADFGLAKFILSFSHSCHHSSTSLLGPRGSIGYIAPEYGFGSKLSTEGNVYSYGIIILEILTGKHPTDGMFTNGLNLHKYVEKAFPQKIAEVLDPCIVPSSEDDGVDSCILHLVKLGLLCSMETPNDRPTMQDVYAEAITIKEAFAVLHG
ncbi:hypothetical protein SETIT_4G231300v2 [Setaria italica]|uniref:Receptor kinase-like protein Xa21 n=1 Tax=Setaria italica TaxID=4555 RepID=A0A368QXA6_SETIT|nr:hypothetical protein SETIT_4G231300v2 [Setaria italica]